MRFGIREFVFVALLVAMPVLVYLWPLQKMDARIADIRAEAGGWQTKLNQLEEQMRRESDLVGKIDKLTKAIHVFEQKLPAEREVEVILKEVWELAAKNKLKPHRVQTDKPVTTASYAELPIRMTINGDFDGFYEFMLALEKLPRITRMPKMKLSKERNAEGHMVAEMVMSIFFDSDQAKVRS
jgi:type IV pilus assembly protein PilO